MILISIFRVVLGFSSLKGSGALIVSHPTRWTFSVGPSSGCWPLGEAVDICVKIFTRRGEVSEVELYWERAAVLFEQSLFLKQVWYQFRLSVRITAFLTTHERHRFILVSKYVHFERAELGFGVTELREGVEVSSWEVELWLNQSGLLFLIIFWLSFPTISSMVDTLTLHLTPWMSVRGSSLQGFQGWLQKRCEMHATALMLWKENNRRGFKRARTSLVDHCISDLTRVQQHVANIQDEYKSILASSALCLLEGHAKRKQQKYKEEPADARSKRFESERNKFSLLLAELIREAGLPVADTINKLDDPKEGWLRLFSTRRANTLKNRYKAWKPFRDWLEIHRARVFPLSLKDVVDYMQFRMNEPCGKSVPGAFSTTSLHLMELVGRVPDAEKISKDPLWDGFVRSWTAELNEAGPATTPAPMFSVAMCISLECRVVDEYAPIFSRALAWVVLLMVWSSFRCDDVQAIIPHRTLISQIGLRLTLGRSKTTGPDKPQKEVKAFVFRQASFVQIQA